MMPLRLESRTAWPGTILTTHVSTDLMKQLDNSEPKNEPKTFHPHQQLFSGIVAHE
jgi:hypothetical protein